MSSPPRNLRRERRIAWRNSLKHIRDRIVLLCTAAGAVMGIMPSLTFNFIYPSAVVISILLGITGVIIGLLGGCFAGVLLSACALGYLIHRDAQRASRHQD